MHAVCGRRSRALKVLYLTGYSDRLFKEKATLWEDEAFLDKPCSVKGLLQAVYILLSGANLRNPRAQLPARRNDRAVGVTLDGLTREIRAVIRVHSLTGALAARR